MAKRDPKLTPEQAERQMFPHFAVMVERERQAARERLLARPVAGAEGDR